MEPFIRNDQYNFIHYQIKVLINGYSTVNDPGVLDALKSLVRDKIFNLFDELSAEQVRMLETVVYVKDSEQGQDYLTELRELVIPFQPVSETTLKKLYPKVKKLKLPGLSDLDFRELSYLGWNDYGQESKYIVAHYDGKLKGLKGTFKNSSKKGLCSICNTFGNVGMYVSESKKSSQGTYIKKGNYICQDSLECNGKLRDLVKLNEFIERMNH
ncbi:FusB/FusC family EF-G-binding protein [Bacillus haikouensis]|uniref:FusB/FusC family EF-G-binding protein n=1 Tax=Bacillus haikouensis TaxID=1510468 RepID=UPI0015578785|nr:FusB/FusC family EF-G-binding protein [Bacillus haikouensis]NQD64836.1 FusB/FusC family EF-G-binding protein [Bacillus haikouensis]